MDFEEIFDRQGQVFDDLLMAAAKLSGEDFAAPGPEGGPSLRDLLVELLDTPRRFVHGALQGRKHSPLIADRIPSPLALGPVFGGFRLTLRDIVENLSPAELAREVTVTNEDGTTETWTVDRVLRHLVAEDARVAGLAAERLRQLRDATPDPD